MVGLVRVDMQEFQRRASVRAYLLVLPTSDVPALDVRLLASSHRDGHQHEDEPHETDPNLGPHEEVYQR